MYSCRRDGRGGLWERVEPGVRPIPCRALQRPIPGTWASTLLSAEPREPAAPSPTVHPLLPKPAEGENQTNVSAQILSTVVSSRYTCSNQARGLHDTEPSAFSLSVFAVAGVGQPGAGGWLCRPAALPGDNWNCGGAPPHSAGSALSLCHTGPTAQVEIRAKLSKKKNMQTANETDLTI